MMEQTQGMQAIDSIIELSVSAARHFPCDGYGETYLPGPGMTMHNLGNTKYGQVTGQCCRIAGYIDDLLGTQNGKAWKQYQLHPVLVDQG